MSSTRSWKIAALCGLVLAAGVGHAEGALYGRVVKIADGDTLTVLTEDEQQIRIRLSEIDAPESGQPYGQAARRLLSHMAHGKEVRIAVDDIDRYGRTVGQVYVGNSHINAALVSAGAAWCYRKYLRGSWCLLAEHRAMESGAGLWALQEDQRIPPWEWRRARRK